MGEFCSSPCESQSFSLFWGSGSVPCWRVMICLEEKALRKYDSQKLSFLNGEHKSEQLLDINPRGQVKNRQNDNDVSRPRFQKYFFFAFYFSCPLLNTMTLYWMNLWEFAITSRYDATLRRPWFFIHRSKRCLQQVYANWRTLEELDSVSHRDRSQCLHEKHRLFRLINNYNAKQMNLKQMF